MVGAQKNQFKKGENVLFSLLGEQFLVQTIEETDFRTPDPIALFLRHCRTSPIVGFHNFSTSAVKDKKNQRKVKHETPIQTDHRPG
jgi:hypothetical protein